MLGEVGQLQAVVGVVVVDRAGRRLAHACMAAWKAGLLKFTVVDGVVELDPC
jgi:hypothetical protein